MLNLFIGLLESSTILVSDKSSGFASKVISGLSMRE